MEVNRGSEGIGVQPQRLIRVCEQGEKHRNQAEDLLDHRAPVRACNYYGPWALFTPAGIVVAQPLARNGELR
jgi:hypothetical protein